MKIIRTIHPVGQGAFYSERFLDENDNKIALVVYDCGSKNTKYLTTEISSFFQKGETIDILFISHFDDDHINGIMQLKKLKIKIKTIVIPFIDKNDEWFYICAGNSNLQQQAIKNTKSFFDTDNIIRVSYVSDNMAYIKHELSTLDLSTELLDREVYSGTPISSKKISKYWHYIPFNFQEKTRKIKLITALKKNPFFKGLTKQRNCKIEDLLHNDTFIKKHYREINAVYKSICTDGANRCSLIVFSGTDVRSFCTYFRIHYSYCIYPQNTESCLFLGDTDLNQGRGHNKILKHLKEALSQYINRIGIIQLPHHGASKNYNKSLLTINDNTKIFFASFGSKNMYGHPGYGVIEDIIYKDHCFCGVSECRDSGLIEIIHI